MDVLFYDLSASAGELARCFPPNDATATRADIFQSSSRSPLAYTISEDSWDSSIQAASISGKFRKISSPSETRMREGDIKSRSRYPEWRNHWGDEGVVRRAQRWPDVIWAAHERDDTRGVPHNWFTYARGESEGNMCQKRLNRHFDRHEQMLEIIGENLIPLKFIILSNFMLLRDPSPNCFQFSRSNLQTPSTEAFGGGITEKTIISWHPAGRWRSFNQKFNYHITYLQTLFMELSGGETTKKITISLHLVLPGDVDLQTLPPPRLSLPSRVLTHMEAMSHGLRVIAYSASITQRGICFSLNLKFHVFNFSILND
jgi:hypothetical protein